MKNLSLIELYKAIIKTPTISAFEEKIDQSNRGLIEQLGNWLEDKGFHITIQKVPKSRNKYNLLARLGTGEGGLLLAGHSDTVPFDEDRWNSDPFTLTEKDGKLYGLGTCDMKGFFAFILEALNELDLSKLQKPLYILATADEETSMAGARFFAEQQLITPDMAIIGEPTELKPIIQHKGHMAHTLSIRGEAGHSSDPAKGVNAIEIMNAAINELMQFRDQLARRYRDERFSVPEATLNLGHIHGGDGENRICGHCHLNFDLRATPDLPDAEAIRQIDEALAPLKKRYPDRLSLAPMYDSIPAFACGRETRLVELAQSLTGFEPTSANYCTEAPFINQLGCDTIVMGPGSIEQAHQPDEFIDLSYVKPTIGVLREMIVQSCLVQ
ncbi:Acetylornithine deacetylase [Saliniradius amylolyticus]|uniref:Acetylornithine deacetylase n=1 Tax=Saliniradius amylolyticus TaxID=2183582 RepID=A0A2S2E6Q4_9ALTE|nr:acetylornithine deacetylase [Saliniradius amylolyticus]AWL13212.1 Acetylornithine deacetylase [Saliniradius amylolyticus]